MFAWFVIGSALTRQLRVQQLLGCVYAQGGSFHTKPEQNEKSLKLRFLNGGLGMDGRMQMGKCSEIECLDVGRASNTFVQFEHLCHLFAEQ